MTDDDRRGLRTPADFDAIYAGQAPWDVGRPQPAFAALAAAGALRGRVLDAGCGTGEHALLAAQAGCEVVGVDFASSAIAQAQAKARARRVAATFRVGDALDAEALGGPYDVVLDCGVFHVFDDADRARYVAALRRATAPGARVYVLAMSEEVPGDVGPRRVREAELRAAFADGWRVLAIEPSVIEATFAPAGLAARFATIDRA